MHIRMTITYLKDNAKIRDRYGIIIPRVVNHPPFILYQVVTSSICYNRLFLYFYFIIFWIIVEATLPPSVHW